MQDLTPAIIAILQKYMGDPSAAVETSTTLSDLEIDLLDLPMICLDIEDAFDVQVQYDEDSEGFSTVRGLITCVDQAIVVKATQPKRTSVPRSTRGWMSA